MADTITIRNPDVVRDIEKLAERTGREPAEAVAEAVRARLGEREARTPEEIAERRRKVEAVLSEFRELRHEGEPLTDEDLYDEDGMPR